MIEDINAFLRSEDDYPACMTGERTIYSSELKLQVANLAVQLRDMPQQRFLLAVNDTVYFIYAILALLCTGKQVRLLANNQPGTLNEGLDTIDGIVSDIEIKTDLPLVHPGRRDSTKSDWKTVCGEIKADTYLEIFTSGTTGEPKQINKPWHTFYSELRGLDTLWGDDLAESFFVSTVSHQHIYGLLFRVLWPLLGRHMFLAENIEYPEQIIKLAAQHEQLVLVSSPAYLKRMIDVFSKRYQDNTIRCIFSSGGPLARDVALEYKALLGFSPVEVLGSTETGGVAFRQQSESTEIAWHSLPEVRVRLEENTGALQVQSPYCFTSDWYTMGDRAEIISGKEFRLAGRMDRIVKLEEKRLSLDSMEKVLQQMPEISQARVIDIPGKRIVLGVVMVLTEEGCAKLQQKGRKEFAQHVRQYLARFFERVTLPRKWRYVDDFPYNAQGKLTRQDLLQLFESDA